MPRADLTGLRCVKYRADPDTRSGLAVIGVVVESERRLRGVHLAPAPGDTAGGAGDCTGRRLAHTISHCAQCHGEDRGGKLPGPAIFRAAPLTSRGAAAESATG